MKLHFNYLQEIVITKHNKGVSITNKVSGSGFSICKDNVLGIELAFKDEEKSDPRYEKYVPQVNIEISMISGKFFSMYFGRKDQKDEITKFYKELETYFMSNFEIEFSPFNPVRGILN